MGSLSVKLALIFLVASIGAPLSFFAQPSRVIGGTQVKDVSHYYPQGRPTAFVYPLMDPRISSKYGRRVHPIRRFSARHHGIDLAAPVGSPIRSIAEGRVVFADPYAGFGKLVVIQHHGQLTSHYAHCDRIRVQPGQWVKAGQIIAEVGSTGLSTGPHLHLEIRISGEPRNPEAFIPGLGAEAQG